MNVTDSRILAKGQLQGLTVSEKLVYIFACN